MICPFLAHLTLFCSAIFCCIIFCKSFIFIFVKVSFFFFFFFFLTYGLSQKGLIKQGSPVRPSVRPIFRLSVSFLRIGSLVFSEIQHGVRDQYIVMCNSAGIFGKNPHRAKIPKMVKNGQKTGFLDFLRKSCNQFCLEFL